MQWGPIWLVTIPILAVVVFRAVGSGDTELTWWAVLVGLAMVLLVAVALHFSRMETLVTEELVRASFGRGWPRREVRIAEVSTVEVVRNKWWYGWGIRKVPEGWMYNVGGLDAVELVLKSGRVFRIGSNEPEDLAAVIALDAHD